MKNIKKLSEKELKEYLISIGITMVDKNSSELTMEIPAKNSIAIMTVLLSTKKIIKNK